MNLKIAVVHDWLVTNAGAEKVLKAILELYPSADVFSIVDFLSDDDRKTVLNGKYSKTSFIQHLPFAKKYFRNYLPLFPKAIESFDLSDYDLIISSSWAFAKGVKTTKNQLHICYCHTPIRYAWDLYAEYTLNLKQPKRFITQLVLKYIRKWDIKSLDRVDYFIANSNFVKERIERIYNKNSIVIYPPVDVDKFTVCDKKEDFYLTASRLVPYKKTKLIVEAFNQMPNKKLVVIGAGEEYEEIKRIKKENIVLMGYLPVSELIENMQKAKAFIYAAIEDFGIVPIEANSCGTPVIALNKGGTEETIEDKINGIHFKNQTSKDIIDAVNNFEDTDFNYENISKNTQKYSTLRFKDEMKEFIYNKINQR